MAIWGTYNSKFNKKTVRSLLLIDCKVTDLLSKCIKARKSTIYYNILSEVSRRRKNEKEEANVLNSQEFNSRRKTVTLKSLHDKENAII